MIDKQPVLRPGISVVIPVYNSEQSLPGLVERLEAVLPHISRDFEVVLVDDGSRDGSWEKVCELAGNRHWIHGIHLMRNYGQHNALLCGIRAARYAVVVTMDDDGQHPPEEIPRLINTLQEGYDLVFGVPEEQQHVWWRTVASRFVKVIMRSILGAETARQISAFKAFHTRIRGAFAEYRDAFVSIDVLLGWGAARIGSVRVRHEPRRHGRTNYSFSRLVTHTLNMITSFSVLPLRLASVIGFLFTLFGAGVLAYVLGRYILQGGSVAGFPFLASIIAIFSGAQLFALGIIGEYLARIHFRSMQKPAYAVAEEITSRASERSAFPAKDWNDELKTA
jgi:glycosyltransferase involved in cell wall biosynthesis